MGTLKSLTNNARQLRAYTIKKLCDWCLFALYVIDKVSLVSFCFWMDVIPSATAQNAIPEFIHFMIGILLQNECSQTIVISTSPRSYRMYRPKTLHKLLLCFMSFFKLNLGTLGLYMRLQGR